MRQHFYTYPHVVELRNRRDRSAPAAATHVRVAPAAAPAAVHLAAHPQARVTEATARW